MIDQSNTPQVHHKPATCRFELTVDGATAILEYTMQLNTIFFTHTLVPPALEGRGLGSLLARAGLDFAREKALKVRPVCWFVAGYIDRHSEYQDLLY